MSNVTLTTAELEARRQRIDAIFDAAPSRPFFFERDHELHAGSGFVDRDLMQQQYELSDNRRTRD